MKIQQNRNELLTRPAQSTDLGDHVVGFGAIDLSPLLKGFPSVCGWYNVIDFTGKIRGQIKVEVKPLKTEANLDLLRRHQSSIQQGVDNERMTTAPSFNRDEVTATPDSTRSSLEESQLSVLRPLSSRVEDKDHQQRYTLSQ